MPDNIWKSKRFYLVLSIAGALVILLAVFWFGMIIGEKRADFRNHWGENYGRFFGEPRPGFFGEPFQGGPMNPYGSAGTVLSVRGGVIVAKGSDNNEKTILVSSSTIIRERASALTVNDIKPGDSMVAIGAPNGSGQIEARLIRIFPAGLNSSVPPNR